MASKRKQAVEMTEDLVKQRKAEAVGFGVPAIKEDDEIEIAVGYLMIDGEVAPLPPGYEIVIRKAR